MASPQIENGHTRIANELLEAICNKLTNSTWIRVMLYTSRLTYGWRRVEVQSHTQSYATKLNLSKDTVKHSLSEMHDRKMLIVVWLTPETFVVKINKNYEGWNV